MSFGGHGQGGLYEDRSYRSAAERVNLGGE